MSKNNGLHYFHQRKEECFWRCSQPSANRIRISHRPKAMAGLKSTSIVDWPPLAECFEVRDACGWGNDHARSSNVGTPAQFEIFTMKRKSGVVSTERLEKVGAYKGHRTRNVENIPHCIVLLLIKITPLDVRRGMAETIRTHTHRKQSTSIAPIHQLGTNDSRIRTKRLFDQQSNCIRFKPNIVVAKQIERSTLYRHERLVG
jgi:hypothetical protein